MRRAARPARPAAPPPTPGGIDELIQATLKAEARPGAEAAERARRREARNAEAEEKLVAALKRGVAALLDRKAEKVVVLNLAGVSTLSDYFVVASATNEKQAQAMADAVEEAMKAEGRRPLSVEGYLKAAWILLDYGDVVFHVFDEESRRFYGLERLWGDAADATATFAG